MNWRLRSYWVDEDDRVHRIPVTRYDRIFRRKEAIFLFAGRRIRFIEVLVRPDELGRLEVQRPCFTHHLFDEAGLLDEREYQSRMRAFSEAYAAKWKPGNWHEILYAERKAVDQWEPSEEHWAQVLKLLEKESKR